MKHQHLRAEHRAFGAAAFALAALMMGMTDEAFGQTCPSYVLATPKGQALYLFFPTTSSSVTVGGTTYNIGDFDVADLAGSIGTTAQLRNRIFEIVRDTYCELSVDVKQTTSTPSPAETRWQIVGIGTDTGGGEFGNSFVVDMGDSEGQDFARVWAQQFQSSYGGSGGSLTGSLSTLERWAVSIGGTAAHEGGHNYGLNHTDATPRSGSVEDPTLNHVMATSSDFGSTVFERGDNRAKRIRHFSDKSFEILGHNVGLNFKTLSNWDFVNPNDTNATRLTITLLSAASAMTRGWFYTGSLSPWTDPVLTKQPGTQPFQGTTHNVYELSFSTAKSWSGGADGTVPAGVKFHVGAAVSDAALVYEVTLHNGATELPLKPRMFGYDAGTAGTDEDGDFAITFFNPDPENGDLILRDVQVLFLPRPVDISNMVVGGSLVSREGLPVTPFPRRPGTRERGRGEGTTVGSLDRSPEPAIRHQIQELSLGRNPVSIPIARLSDERHVDVTYDSTGCTPGIRTANGFTPFEADIDVGEVIYCPDGPALSLFPATYTYVMATVVDPDAEHWDPAQGRLVTGPLETRLFYQFAGIVPDFNDNGVDDLLDIRGGVSRDDNGNGLPDEVERRKLAASARIGATLPQADTLDPGLSVNLGLEYYVAPHVTLEGVLGYHAFESSGSNADLDAWQLSVNGRFYLPTATRLKPYANAGAGAYKLDPGSTEFGYNAGVGLDYELRPNLALEGAYNYHDVDPGNLNIEFSTLQIGLRWQL
jgi:opacity protein-like surface antigen